MCTCIVLVITIINIWFQTIYFCTNTTHLGNQGFIVYLLMNNCHTDYCKKNFFKRRMYCYKEVKYITCTVMKWWSELPPPFSALSGPLPPAQVGWMGCSVVQWHGRAVLACPGAGVCWTVSPCPCRHHTGERGMGNTLSLHSNKSITDVYKMTCYTTPVYLAVNGILCRNILVLTKP